MKSIAIQKSDTITIEDRVITDYDSGTLEIPELRDTFVSNVKSGKGGNLIASVKRTGTSTSLRLAVTAASPDDIFLEKSKMDFEADPPSFILLQAHIRTKSAEHVLSDGFVESRVSHGALVDYVVKFGRI
jgi:hypothetical protein